MILEISDNMIEGKKSIAIIGAGMTGLPIGLEFCKKGYDVKILEKNSFVGGIATSISSNGYVMDIGPHYVTLKNDSEITESVVNMIGETNLVKLPDDIRRSRNAYFYGKFWNEFPTINQFLSQIDKKIIFQIISDISGNKLKKSLKLSRPKTAKEYLISNYGKFLYENWFKPYYRNLFFDKNPSLESVKKKFPPINITKALSTVSSKSEKPNKKGHVEKGYFNCYFKGGMITLVKSLENEIIKYGGKIETGVNIKEISHDRKKISYERNSDTFELLPDVIVYALPLNVAEKWFKDKKSKEDNQINALNSIMIFLFVDTEKLFDKWIIDSYDDDVVFWRISQQSFLSNSVTPPNKTLLSIEIRAKEDSSVWISDDETIYDRVISDLKKVKILQNEKIDGFKILKLRNVYPLNPDRINDDTVKNLINSFDNEYAIGTELDTGIHLSGSQSDPEAKSVRLGGVLIDMMNAKTLANKIMEKI